MAPNVPSTRRPRSSVNLVDNVFNEGPSQPTVDVECTPNPFDAAQKRAYDPVRRKHSRQNKEIIAENVRHKTAMKVLNLEIGSLQEELMEVKQINRILSLQMKKVKEDQARVNTASAIQAVDALLAAMPALQALRQSMVPTAAALPVFEGEVARRNLLRNIGMTIATRPAVVGGNTSSLGMLGEEDDEAEEPLPMTVEAGPSQRPVADSSMATEAPTLNKTPVSESGGKSGVTVRRLAPPGGQSDLIVSCGQRSTASPMSQTMPRSPIPQGLRTSTAPPSLVVNSPASSASASPSPIRRTGASPKRKARRRRESDLVPPVPSLGQDQLHPSSATDAVADTSSQEESSRSTQEPSFESALSSAPSLNESTSSSGSSAVSSALTGLSELSFAEGMSMSFDDDGKRGRRSRTSVNYKEPSLTKKMRKPDGIAVADMLARRQMLHDSQTPSVLPTSGMRRKSVLPSSSAKPSGSSMTGDSEDDADDIDDCLLALEETAELAPVMPTTTAIPSLIDPLSPSSPLSSVGDGISVERMPHPNPPASPSPSKRSGTAVQPSTSHESLPSTTATVTEPQPLRTSPRKQTSTTAAPRMKARRSTAAVPKTAERAPARAARTALADVAEPNYEPRSISDLLAAKQALHASRSKSKAGNTTGR